MSTLASEKRFPWHITSMQEGIQSRSQAGVGKQGTAVIQKNFRKLSLNNVQKRLILSPA